MAGHRVLPGFGPSAPFLFGGVLALIAAFDDVLDAKSQPGQPG